ncbi:MAG: hypothetical protein NBV63_03305 [Candidatus Pacebacteria bacterium]|nr:hypothetical protein [Candidatus Paceibacterota bacterium]
MKSPDQLSSTDTVLILGLAVAVLGLIPGFIVLADDGSWNGFIPTVIGVVAAGGAVAFQTYEFQRSSN